MFVFASMTEGVANLVQNSKGHVYTWPDEKTAREYFEVCKCEAHLYQVSMDLYEAWLIELGDHQSQIENDESFLLTEDQKKTVFDSYVYKSMLEWTPLEQTLEVEA